MATLISIFLSLTLWAYACSKKSIPFGVPMCPTECYCYYQGINWQTDCSESNLTTVPQDRIDPNAYTLIMNTNHLKKIDPFRPNFKIRSVQLSHNSLTTIQKEAFVGLKYLLDVGLSSNLINYIHPEAFIENVGFITLQLQNNSLKPVEGPFLYSKTLRFLYLENCQLTALSHKFFAELKGLIKVDLSGNPLRIFEPGVFDPLTNVKNVILNNCNLTQIASVAQNLNASVLPEKNLESYINWTLIVGKLINLEHLEVKQSGVTNLPKNVFSNYINIRRLVLAENQISDNNLDTTLGQNLVNIYFLDLSYCNIKTPLTKYAFAKATKLRTLILSGNYLSTSGLGEVFSPLSKLAKLSLSNCGLIQLPANTFQNLTSLKDLDISMNPLDTFYSRTLSTIHRLDSLEHLNMSYTNMDVISKRTFSKMTGLRTLILSGNKIKSFESGYLNNLPRLVLLELKNCGLDKFGSTIFNGISEHPALEELRLSGNRFTLDDDGFFFQTLLPKLKTLDMSYCSLTHWTDFQAYAPSLNRLLLNNNQIKGRFDLYFMYSPLVFEYVDVSYNSFRSFSYKHWLYSDILPADSSNITSLNLIGNPWQCDCYIPTVLKWAKEGVVGNNPSITSRNDNLFCNFNPDKKTPEEGLIAYEPRPAVISGEYTWARYVREFNNTCSCLLQHSHPYGLNRDLSMCT